MKRQASEDYFECLNGESLMTGLVPLSELSDFDLTVIGQLAHGHGIASRPSKKYPDGTVRLQYPIFLKLGLDLGNCYPGTLNISIDPKRFRIHSPTHQLINVDWYTPRGKTEDFLFCDCAIVANGTAVCGWVYLPDPATKVAHMDDPRQIQIICPYVRDLTDGQSIKVMLKRSQIEIL